MRKMSHFSKSPYFLALSLSILSLKSSIFGYAFEENSVIRNEREDLFSSTSKLADMVESEYQVVDLLDTFADYVSDKARTIRM